MSLLPPVSCCGLQLFQSCCSWHGVGVGLWIFGSFPRGGSQTAGANQLMSPIGSLRLIGTSQWGSAKEGMF